MKVIHYNTLGEGGTAVASSGLHRGLLSRDVDSRIITKTPAYGVPDHTVENRGGRTGKLLEKLRHWRRTGYAAPTGSFQDARVRFSPHFAPGNFDAHIVHLHWVSNWLDIPGFLASIPEKTPVLWSLHDLFPVTGGCHINFGCEHFINECGNCPQLRAPRLRDRSYKNLSMKRKAYRTVALHAVANSQWMLKQMERSGLGREWQSQTLIHIGTDLTAFQPRDRKEARALLGIRPDAKVILFGAADLNDYNKNFQLLNQAVQQVAERRNWQFLFFGNGWPTGIEMALPARSLGYVSEPALLSLAYAAADLYVMPSKFESFGLGAVQALACGRPAIVTKVGGLTDIVEDGSNGLLVDSEDAGGLARGLKELLGDDPKAVTMGTEGRRKAERAFDFNRTIDQYLKLYQTVLGMPS